MCGRVIILELKLSSRGILEWTVLLRMLSWHLRPATLQTSTSLNMTLCKLTYWERQVGPVTLVYPIP